MVLALFHVYTLWLNFESASQAALLKSDRFRKGAKRNCPATPDHLVFLCISVVPSRATQVLENVKSFLDQTFSVDIIVCVSEIFAREFREAEEFAFAGTVKTLATMSNRIQLAYRRDRGRRPSYSYLCGGWAICRSYWLYLTMIRSTLLQWFAICS
jgi:hypothetical protein